MPAVLNWICKWCTINNLMMTKALTIATVTFKDVSRWSKTVFHHKLKQSTNPIRTSSDETNTEFITFTLSSAKHNIVNINTSISDHTFCCMNTTNWVVVAVHAHIQLFYGPFSGTTWVSRCQKKYFCGLHGARESIQRQTHWQSGLAPLHPD